MCVYVCVCVCVGGLGKVTMIMIIRYLTLFKLYFLLLNFLHCLRLLEIPTVDPAELKVTLTNSRYFTMPQRKIFPFSIKAIQYAFEF